MLTEHLGTRHVPLARLVQVQPIARRTAILRTSTMAVAVVAVVAVVGGGGVGGCCRRGGQTGGGRGGEAARERRDVGGGGGGEGWVDERGVTRVGEGGL